MESQSINKLKTGSIGAILGGILVMIIGFNWGGWTSATTARENAERAVLAYKAELCVAQFMMTPKHQDQLKEFMDTQSWKRSQFVEKGGWDKMPGEETARGYVSSACSDKLVALAEK